MKRFTLLFILIAGVLVVSACGSPAPAETQPPAMPEASTPTQAPAASEVPAEPTSTEAAPAETGAQVMITLGDNTIATSQTSFQAGVPYTFVITNTGQRVHNFNINPPVSVAGSLEAALGSALLVVEQEHLSPGAVSTVEFTFPASAVGAQLEFSCLIRRHYDDGMHQEITVTG